MKWPTIDLRPALLLPIDDRNAAEFWMNEWRQRFAETNDYAFKEAIDALQYFMDTQLGDEDDL